MSSMNAVLTPLSKMSIKAQNQWKEETLDHNVSPIRADIEPLKDAAMSQLEQNQEHKVIDGSKSAIVASPASDERMVTSSASHLPQSKGDLSMAPQTKRSKSAPSSPLLRASRGLMADHEQYIFTPLQSSPRRSRSQAVSPKQVSFRRPIQDVPTREWLKPQRSSASAETSRTHFRAFSLQSPIGVHSLAQKTIQYHSMAILQNLQKQYIGPLSQYWLDQFTKYPVPTLSLSIAALTTVIPLVMFGAFIGASCIALATVMSAITLAMVSALTFGAVLVLLPVLVCCTVISALFAAGIYAAFQVREIMRNSAIHS